MSGCTRPTTSRSLRPGCARLSARAACTCGLNGDPVSTKENEYSHH